MNAYTGRCRAELVSMTQALKAQRALAASAIPVNVVKIESGSSLRGCSYGIEFSCSQKNNVTSLLNSAGISVRKWNTVD